MAALGNWGLSPSFFESSPQGMVHGVAISMLQGKCPLLWDASGGLLSLGSSFNTSNPLQSFYL